jgi:nitroreductase
MMSVEEAITGRHCFRAFLPKPVPRELIEKILTIAGRAPSGSNIQPWKVWVLEGAVRDEICRDLVERYDRAPLPGRNYNYYPEKWFEPYLARRRACGWGLYGVLGIGRQEKDKMHAQHARNFTFFDAPVGLIFSIDRDLEQGSWLDYACFCRISWSPRGRSGWRPVRRLHSSTTTTFCSAGSAFRTRRRLCAAWRSAIPTTASR